MEMPVNTDVYGHLVVFDTHLAEKEGQIQKWKTQVIRGLSSSEKYRWHRNGHRGNLTEV